MEIKKFNEFGEDKNNNIDKFVESLNELTNKYNIVIKSVDNIYLMNYDGELGKIEYNYIEKKYIKNE